MAYDRASRDVADVTCRACMHTNRYWDAADAYLDRLLVTIR